MYWKLFLSLLLFPFCMALDADVIVAFQGAEGFGRFAQGGVEAYNVTSLEDSLTPAPGTLRYALEVLDQPYYINITVQGTINLLAPIVVNRPYITIGVARGFNGGVILNGYGLNVTNTHDVVIHNLRLQNDLSEADHSATSILIENSQRVILDHITTLHGADGGLKVTGSRDITVQWCIFAETFFNYNCEGALRCGFGAIFDQNTGGVTCHHNLIMSHMSKNPLISNSVNDSFVDFRNNVIYNYGCDAGISLGTANINLVGNFYKTGPSTDLGLGYGIFNCSDDTKIYSDGNALVYQNQPVRIPVVLNGQAQAEPFFVDNVLTDKATVAFEKVLDTAGAFFRLRNGTESRLIAEVKIGQGSIPGFIPSL